ncbi:MAG: hypothetical protein MI784_12095 [Cytophagales bacterium]|nr:hypothetical protein [Cytophagales bacterium]
MSLSETLHAFVDKVALKNEEVYAKIGTVAAESVDTEKGTCTVKPIDGTPEIYDVRLKAAPTPLPGDIRVSSDSKSELKSIASRIEVPKEGSYVCVVFINNDNAFIAMNEQVEYIYTAVAPKTEDDDKNEVCTTYSIMRDGHIGFAVENEKEGEFISKVGDAIVHLHKVNEEENGKKTLTETGSLKIGDISFELKKVTETETQTQTATVQVGKSSFVIRKDNNGETIQLSSGGSTIHLTEDSIEAAIKDGSTINMAGEKVTINGALEISK